MTTSTQEHPHSTTLSRTGCRVSWLLQLIAAAILFQTLFFKFTAAPEAVALFEKLGVEPWGRLVLGGIELLVGIALLVPRTALLGALAAAGLMVGAIASHLLILGIEVGGDGGSLFAMACITLVAALGVIWLRRGRLTGFTGA